VQSVSPLRSQPSLRVLLVDDDARVRKTLTRVLVRRGFTVTEADSVASAQRALAAARHDVVVTDLGLGDGTGIEVMACARRLDAATPVVVLSGSLEPLDLRSGAPTSRLNKPTSSAELIDAVISAAGSRRRRRTSAAVLYAAIEAVDGSVEDQLTRLTEALETLAGAPAARAVEAA
jgi:CheY-like chemotaxis protein